MRQRQHFTLRLTLKLQSYQIICVAIFICTMVKRKFEFSRRLSLLFYFLNQAHLQKSVGLHEIELSSTLFEAAMENNLFFASEGNAAQSRSNYGYNAIYWRRILLSGHDILRPKVYKINISTSYISATLLYYQSFLHNYSSNLGSSSINLVIHQYCVRLTLSLCLKPFYNDIL